MRIDRLARAHSLTGWLGFLGFLASGIFLARGRPAIYDGSDLVRALFRANHIYLLCASLLNLLAARVGSVRSELRTRLRTLGSLVLMGVVPLLGFCFVVEPPHGFAGRRLTIVALSLLLVGSLLLVLTTPKAHDPDDL